MELLKKLTKSYKPLSLGTLVALLTITNITSCKSCNQPGEENQNYTPKPETGMQLQVTTNKVTVRGTEVATVTVENIGSVAVNPADIMLTLGSSSTTATFNLPHATGVKNAYEARLDEVLGNKNTISPSAKVTFTIQLNNPTGPQASEITLTFKETIGGAEIIKKDNFIKFINSNKIQLNVTTDKKEFTEKEVATSTVENIGSVGVNPADIMLTLGSSNTTATFNLPHAIGVKNAYEARLDEVLGNKNTISPTAKVNFTIQLNNPTGPQASEITLTFKETIGETEIIKKDNFIKFINSNKIQLDVITDKKEITEKELATVTVENIGSDINPSDIIVTLNFTNGATFDLQNLKNVKTTAEVTLETILGNTTPIASKAKVKFTIGLHTPTLAKASDIGLTFKQKSSKATIVQKDNFIKFITSKEIQLSATTDKEEITGKELATVTIQNKGKEVKPADITVQLKVNNGKASFNLGSKKATRDKDEMTLETILGNNAPIALGSVVKFTMELDNPNGAKISSINLTFKQTSNQAIIIQEENFIKCYTLERINLEVTATKDKIKAQQKTKVTLKNIGIVDVKPADITIKFGSSSALAIFNLMDISGIPELAVKNETEKTLQEILGSATVIKPTEEVAFYIKLNDAKGATNSAISLLFKKTHGGGDLISKPNFIQWSS